MTTAALTRAVRETDEERRRATFGVHYPQVDLLLATKEEVEDLKGKKAEAGDEKATVRHRRVHIQVEYRNLEVIVFEQCNFHYTRGQSRSEMKNVSFRGCDFRSSFFGTLFAYRVHFTDCTFLRCDFSRSELAECRFVRCTFRECSGDNLILTRTAISPAGLMDGFICPLYNFSAATDRDKRYFKRDWIRLRLRVAEQLYQSTNEIHNSVLTDESLYVRKKAELTVAVDAWLHGPFPERVRTGAETLLHVVCVANPLRWMRLLVQWANIALTSGGTSVFRLMLSLFGLVIMASIALLYWPVEYHDVLIGTDVGPRLTVLWLATLLARATTLVLAFGFTSFMPRTLGGEVVTVAFTALGLTWYSMMVPVVLRRITR